MLVRLRLRHWHLVRSWLLALRRLASVFSKGNILSFSLVDFLNGFLKFINALFLLLDQRAKLINDISQLGGPLRRHPGFKVLQFFCSDGFLLLLRDL